MESETSVLSSIYVIWEEGGMTIDTAIHSVLCVACVYCCCGVVGALSRLVRSSAQVENGLAGWLVVV